MKYSEVLDTLTNKYKKQKNINELTKKDIIVITSSILLVLSTYIVIYYVMFSLLSYVFTIPIPTLAIIYLVFKVFM